jgi:transposase
MAKRATYSEAFKQEAVELSRSSGKPIAQIARALGIRPQLLYRWRHAQAAAEAVAADPVVRRQCALQAENARLRRQLARLQQELEILEKAVLIEALAAQAHKEGDDE